MKKSFIFLQSSSFYKVFLAPDEYSKGRLCMLLSTVFNGIAANLSGGIFYSGFLLAYGIDIVNIGILTFVPYIASLFCLVSPALLERLNKRKILLFSGRLLYYTINILGLTLLPNVITDPRMRVAGIALTSLVASVVNNISAPGYTVWHANFLEDKVRAEYFAVSACVSSITSGIFLIITSAITDSLTPDSRLFALSLIRYIAFVVAIADCIVLLFPKEYEYKTAQIKRKFYDCIVLPIKNKKFFLTIAVIVIYNFSNTLSASVVNVWLLDEVGATYTFVNVLNTVYFLFFIFFSGMAKRMLNRYNVLNTFGMSMLIWSITQIGFGFVNHSNYMWLMLIVRLLQHWAGVIITISCGVLLYVNLPETDRTNYISFYTALNSISLLFSMVLGTQFVSILGDFTLDVFGFSFSSVPLLQFIMAFLFFGTAVTSFKLSPKLIPEKEVSGT